MELRRMICKTYKTNCECGITFQKYKHQGFFSRNTIARLSRATSHPLPTTISTSCPIYLLGEEGEKNTVTKNTVITLREGGQWWRKRGDREGQEDEREKMSMPERLETEEWRNRRVPVRAKMWRRAFTWWGVTAIKMFQRVSVQVNMCESRITSH